MDQMDQRQGKDGYGPEAREYMNVNQRGGRVWTDGETQADGWYRISRTSSPRWHPLFATCLESR